MAEPTSRRRSPAPPIPPSKERERGYLSSNIRHSSQRPTSQFVNSDLADAVRDSVYIGPNAQGLDFSRREPPPIPQSASSANSLSPVDSEEYASIIDCSVRQGAYASSRYSSLDMAPPSLPSQILATQNQNPFEQDEPIASGKQTVERQKYVRSNTT
jgi:hypothetical protein